MKTLVVYYSLTGNTKKIAEMMAKSLKADIEEIQDLKNRNGLWRQILSTFEALFKKTTLIAPFQHNPADYDLVIIGTPIWATVSCAVRTWLLQYGKWLKKRVAFFATMGSRGDAKTFKDMALLVTQPPIAQMAFLEKEIKTDHYQQRLNEFLSQVVR